MMDLLKSILEWAFDNNYVNIFNNITGSISTYSSLVSNVSSLLIPIGISLVVLFWMIEFLNRSIRFQESNFGWEHITMLTVKLVIAKYIVQASSTILDLFATIANEIAKTISVGATTMDSIDYIAIVDYIDSQKVIVKTQLFFSVLLFGVLLFIINLLINIIIYGRIFEIIALTIFSPIPLSTITFDGVKDLGKRYLQNYFAVCFQGAIIMVILLIFNEISKNAFFPDIGSNPETNIIKAFGEYMVISVTLIFALFKSGSWASKIIGSS